MQLALAAKRVSSLPPHLLDVVACVSEGMSNRQVAERLGYKNARTVGTLVYEINKKLGLERISSRTEKRRLLIDAFRTARTSAVGYLASFMPWLSSTPIATCIGVIGLLWLTTLANFGGPSVTGRIGWVSSFRLVCCR